MPEKKVTKVEFPQKPSGKKDAIPKKRVAAYSRVSTAKDAQENSLQAQREYYVRYIKRHSDWTLVDGYADDGISGLRPVSESSYICFFKMFNIFCAIWIVIFAGVNRQSAILLF